MLREYVRIRLPGPVDPEMSEKILTTCLARLKARRPTKLERSGNTVRFVGGYAIRPGMSFSLMVSVSRGEVTVEQTANGNLFLVFRASVLDFLVFMLAAVGFGEVACIFMGAPLVAYVIWPVLCLFMLGVVILEMRVRFRWFFKRCIKLALEQPTGNDV